MILYCRHCKEASREQTCPCCGRELTWPVLPEDPCFLAEQTGLWAGLLEDVLRRSAIPFERRSAQGAALMTLVGSYHARFRFYVPYEYLSRGEEVVEALFSRINEENDLDTMEEDDL